MSNTTEANLTSGRLLARNVVWNILGPAVPLLVGLAVIPTLLQKLGTARFGILTLSWAVIGYSSLFDLGLSRALTKLVAEKFGSHEEESLPPLIWTGLGLMFLTGVLGSLIMAAGSPWLVHSALKVPAGLQHETLIAFYEIMLTVPIVIVASGLRGILEARQLFAAANAVRTPLGILTFLAPWLVLFFSRSLIAVLFSLLLVRLLSLFAQLWCVLWYMPFLRHRARWQGSAVRPLLAFGGWMTVSNIISPIMVNLDRFLIGAFISISAVAYYATPFELVSRLGLVPGAVAGVLFPAFSAMAEDRDRLCRLLDRGLNGVFILLFPLSLVVATFAYPGMRLWLGEPFAQHSFRVLQWLTIGVFINSLAQIPFAFVQGIGRPDLTAKFHVAELLLYFPAVFWLIHAHGVTGAAMAWVGRVSLDALALFLLSAKFVPQSMPVFFRISMRLTVATLIFILGMIIPGLLPKLLFVLLTISIFLWAAWSSILGAEERKLLSSRLRALPVFN